VPAPFGWDPAGFWITTLTLGGFALFMAVGIPLSVRRYDRVDRAERERLASVLRGLAALMGGEFAGPREVVAVDDGGGRYPPTLDYGTAIVRSAGLTVEAGVQVGPPAGKSLRLRVELPPGRAWTVSRLRARRLGPWLTRVPAPRTFRLAYGCSTPGRLSAGARSALLVLRADVVDLRLEPDALTVWVLRPTARTDARVDGVRDAPSLVAYVHRTAAVARLLLAND
jgi:hypothetical protein